MKTLFQAASAAGLLALAACGGNADDQAAANIQATGDNIADQLEAQRAAFIGKTADPRAEVQAIVAGDKFDRARAQSLLEDKTRAVQAHSPAVVNAMADFYDSLNPDQQQKVRELMQRRKGWMARG